MTLFQPSDRRRTATAARTAVAPTPTCKPLNNRMATLLPPSHFDMLNISSAFLPTANTPSTRHLLGDFTENALKSWLQKQGREILPDSLFITASVLFGWVDPLDLIAVLHISLRVAAVERQLQQEEYTSITFLVQGGRSLMEERMYRAQMEVSLFSKALANVHEELNIQYHPPTWQRAILKENPVMHVEMPLPVNDDCLSVNIDRSRPSKSTREKCEAWLSTSWQFQTDFPRSQEVPQLYKHVSKPNDTFHPLPCWIKAWVSNVTYGDYISASCVDTMPLCLDNPNSFKAKEDKPLDVLKSDFCILQQMKRRAQSEVDMFSEAIARTAGIQCADDGTCTSSGSATTYESRLPSNSYDDRSDDWFDDSVSSNSSALL
ncbi:hypothetical protein CY34DRAFT_17195 [Suillus luteus UH-Slu-Lm8-n1]|uniref:Uncharacterized protein n=1 Tax=Suillus luteus UH-Slu-Lm8-n1 TaxID=930992 RepID=A0A0D0ALN0_9AGAM|nr:hypothetical protein CY34DRAFT_17195 [Suillus luteus UH-Slu-Lm8-n1]